MAQDWTCICCTYDKNPDADDECFMCGTARQTPGTPHQSQLQGTARQSKLQGTAHQSQLQGTAHQSLDSSNHSRGKFFKRHGQGKPAFKPDENELPSLTVRWDAFKMGSPEGDTNTDSKSKSPNPALYKTRTFRQMTPGIVDSKYT
ncbi:uncharacterized protein LOC121388501 [Gigantopelta aegis]|uniref:uncharacterized protein LOC121388501 n=1 Tax=Gigantopelta aegis TaxID=1735272 RepID=UPI001B8884F3|nr:uncharacterized protein LOC121388501 [Gigantopelta aegis]